MTPQRDSRVADEIDATRAAGGIYNGSKPLVGELAIGEIEFVRSSIQRNANGLKQPVALWQLGETLCC
jgi:hypothetical protein